VRGHIFFMRTYLLVTEDVELKSGPVFKKSTIKFITTALVVSQSLCILLYSAPVT
jgi:hypothetical protein